MIALGRIAKVLPALFLCFGPACNQTAWCHRDRMKDIDHLAFIEPASGFLNIEVVLHFHEIPSEQSRKGRMDTNGDDRISPTEVDRYCSALDQKLLHRFTLEADKKEIKLAPLYRPEVDLLGVSGVEPAPHLLKIFLTARLPPEAGEGAVFRFVDRSFSSVTGQSRMEVRHNRPGSSTPGPVMEISTSREIRFKLPRAEE